MRLDHIAYRVASRRDTAQFFMQAFGYSEGTNFEIKFDDGSKAECIVLVPPEKPRGFITHDLPWSVDIFGGAYGMAPEIFISEGTPGSIVGDWVASREGVGGIHHLAYQVNNVQEKMDAMKLIGYSEFTSEAPLQCPDLTQVFTKPSALTGVIYEFIERGKHGFCVENVKGLMESTSTLK